MRWFLILPRLGARLYWLAALRHERSFHNRSLRELPKWLVPAPRYTRDLRTIRFLRRTIQFYDGRAINLCELMRAMYLVRMRSEETKG
jgi:hypothetical protein